MCLTCKVDPRTTPGFFRNTAKTQERNQENFLRTYNAQNQVSTSRELVLERALVAELRASQYKGNLNNHHQCPHMLSLSKADIIILRRIIEDNEKPRCSSEGCRAESKTWLCLACKSWFCGDYFTGHLAAHTYRYHHCVIFCKDTLSLWCYSCDRYLKSEESGLVSFLLKGRLERYATKMLEARIELVPSVDPDSKGSELVLPGNLSNVFKQKCLHIAEVLEDFSTVPINVNVTCQYNKCKHSDDVSICLSCAKIFCGDLGEKHMALHNIKQEKHAIHLFVNNLSIWCATCQRFLDYRESPRLTAIYKAYYKVKYNAELEDEAKITEVTIGSEKSEDCSDNESVDPKYSSGSSNNSYEDLDSLEIASIGSAFDSIFSEESSNRKRKLSNSLSDFDDEEIGF